MPQSIDYALRIRQQREALIPAIEQAKMQLNALQNQLYILDQIMAPEASIEPVDEPNPDPPGIV